MLHCRNSRSRCQRLSFRRSVRWPRRAGTPILGAACSRHPFAQQIMDFNQRQTLIIAILVLFAGRFLNRQFAPLRQWNIPEPLTGGFLASLVSGSRRHADGDRHHDGGDEGARRESARPPRRSARRCLLRRHRQRGDDLGVRHVAREAGAARPAGSPRRATRRRRVSRPGGCDAATAGKPCVPTAAQHPFPQSEKTACKGFPSLGIAL